MNENHEYVLEMRNISKAFPGVQALDKVNLKVRKGTVHVLVGENGAGKSTLMKILSGEHQIDEGEIYFNGKKLGEQNLKSALDIGISMIYQELSPVLEMNIAENIFLGREPGKKFKSFVDYGDLFAKTQELLDMMNIPYNPKTKMKELSVAGMQLIEITKAISRGASLIIMDEPTSAITDTEVSNLFEQIRSLKSKGVSIIYITHKLDEIPQIADDITVLRDGKYIDSDVASNYDTNRLISQMVGRTISNIFPKEEAEIGEVVLEVNNLTRSGVFENISFQVRKGEILGLAGLVGAGRTEVARAIFGLDPVESGEVFLEGRRIKFDKTIDVIKSGIAMLSEDRKEVGLVLGRSVRENISLPNLKKYAPGLIIKEKEEAEDAAKMIKLLNIKTSNMNTTVKTLSGGNQQKVVLGKWLIGDIKVLILDEPTRGIDVGSKSEIHRLMSQLAQKGLAVIMISSELPEILGMSDRIITMQQGVIKGELSRAEATQEKIMILATGGKLDEQRTAEINH